MSWLAGKNGVYLNLVRDVQSAFRVDDLVKVDCKRMNPSDYKKIGAKLKVSLYSYCMVFVLIYCKFVLASTITIVEQLLLAFCVVVYHVSVFHDTTLA